MTSQSFELVVVAPTVTVEGSQLARGDHLPPDLRPTTIQRLLQAGAVRRVSSKHADRSDFPDASGASRTDDAQGHGDAAVVDI